MYSSPSRMRVEREAARSSNAPVVITTLLSLLVVGAAVAVVAYLVLRAPSSAVDSAERLEPVGTALPAPTEQPALPTVVPTTEPEPEPEPALGFTGDAPAVTALPTVTAPEEPAAVAQDSGPTPTPRVLALPTEVPPTLPPPEPTLPPAAPVTAVPVVALEPVEAPPPTTAAPSAQSTVVPTVAPVVDDDDDPFNIFDDENEPRIVPSGNDALDAALAMQDEMTGGNNRDNPPRDGANADADDEPANEVITVPSASGNGTVDVIMPDVDAMIEEITARATDPNRNPNVANVIQPTEDDDDDDDDDDVIRPSAERDDDDDDDKKSNQGRRKSARERINERNNRSSNSRGVVVPDIEVVVPGNNTGGNQNQGDCPFESLPEDMRPDDWPFGDC